VVRKSLLVFLVSIPLAFAACGDDDDSASSSTSADTSTASDTSTTSDTSSSSGTAAVSISETEFALDPADPTAEAGEVTIEAVNDGSTVHNLEIEGNGVEEVTDDLEPGSSGEVTVDLDAGTYEIYCAIGDHRAQGMEGELTVE
jgi:plastocyanin